MDNVFYRTKVLNQKIESLNTQISELNNQIAKAKQERDVECQESTLVLGEHVYAIQHFRNGTAVHRKGVRIGSVGEEFADLAKSTSKPSDIEALCAAIQERRKLRMEADAALPTDD
jgi:hypothetical protein